MSFSVLHLIILFHLIGFDTLHKYSTGLLIYNHYWRRKPKTYDRVSAKDLNLSCLARPFGMKTGVYIFSLIKGNFAFEIIGGIKLNGNLQGQK